MPTELRPGCWLIELSAVNAYLVEDVEGTTTTERQASARDDPISVDLSEGADETATESENGDDGATEEVDDAEAVVDAEETDDTEETDDNEEAADTDESTTEPDREERTVLTLVDAGMPFDAPKIERAIEEAGYTTADVDRVLVTHYDVDHVGGLSRLDLPNATVYMGSPDADYLTGRRSPPVGDHKGALQRLSSLFVSTDLDVETVGDGDRVGSFTVYETPGHTEGHVAYVSSDLSVAFVGDLVRESGGDLQPSSWAISHDTAAVADSIHDLADREPAVEVLAMGHGVPFMRGGAVRLAKLGQRVD
ncbi:MBL fold metallo-hydrolase [Halomarina rubra]|uniref:MBL fold metallo-hydrolase n=1 Tax=Halomarina rubra TaxID=2071873 RepID=A0ABD6AXW2_9EURY|nr:MBL fold metallo-hydrolase [Halomarina rubra]